MDKTLAQILAEFFKMTTIIAQLRAAEEVQAAEIAKLRDLVKTLEADVGKLEDEFCPGGVRPTGGANRLNKEMKDAMAEIEATTCRSREAIDTEGLERAAEGQ
jgi:hypothetical protein